MMIVFVIALFSSYHFPTWFWVIGTLETVAEIAYRAANSE